MKNIWEKVLIIQKNFVPLYSKIKDKSNENDRRNKKDRLPEH